MVSSVGRDSSSNIPVILSRLINYHDELFTASRLSNSSDDSEGALLEFTLRAVRHSTAPYCAAYANQAIHEYQFLLLETWG